MINKDDFLIPEGTLEVASEEELKLAHYELLQLRPKGTIHFENEKRSITFQFMVTQNRSDGIFARLDEPMSPSVWRVFDHLEKNPRTQCYVTLVLLQFKLVFAVDSLQFVRSAKKKTLHLPFPSRFLKTHRRHFIRIPFNDTFPAELSFNSPKGIRKRKVRDISREGMRIKLLPEDAALLRPGLTLKQATLRVLNRDLKLGLNVVQVYPDHQAGLKIIAISESDQTWLKELIRALMKQLLNLKDPMLG